MFRQFALVIAATAIISAINALTLKPTQCALYLRPVAKDRKVNWFYRGFNRGLRRGGGSLHRRRRAGWCAALAPWLCLFTSVVALAAAAFAIYPTTLLPLEDQGYCIVIAQLPAGASQPRVRQRGDGDRRHAQREFQASRAG